MMIFPGPGPARFAAFAAADAPLPLSFVPPPPRRNPASRQKIKQTVTTFTRGAAALKALRERRRDFDIVLSDVHMPDMDGFKLLEHIALELDVPVMMMSANCATDVVLRGIIHGAVDYLLKPVRIEELRNIWQHVVRKKRGDGAPTAPARGRATRTPRRRVARRLARRAQEDVLGEREPRDSKRPRRGARRRQPRALERRRRGNREEARAQNIRARRRRHRSRIATRR